MYLVINDSIYAKKAIEIGKTGIPIRFLRDGVHGENDLSVIAMFQKEGFVYEISTYNGKNEDEAICVDFFYVSKENGYI